MPSLDMHWSLDCSTNETFASINKTKSHHYNRSDKIFDAFIVTMLLSTIKSNHIYNLMIITVIYFTNTHSHVHLLLITTT